MQNTLKTLLVIVLLVTIIKADQGKKYGKEITLKEKTKLAEILKNPESFVGKKVLIEGTVVDVCPNRGCWIKIADDKGNQTIRVKVKDGEIVFPLEAKGKTALVEGEVYSFTLGNKECDTEKHTESEEHKDGCCSKENVSKTV